MLFNECWESGHTPERWCAALVRMLHKRNSTQDVGNYRGISLLDVMGKMYEKVCANRAMAMQVHLAEGQGVHAEQMGFNPGVRQRLCRARVVRAQHTAQARI